MHVVVSRLTVLEATVSNIRCTTPESEIKLAVNLNEETVGYVKFHSLHEASTRSRLVLGNSSKGGLGGAIKA